MRRFLFFLLFFVAVFGGIAQETGDWYQGKPIRNIVFDGLKNIRNSDLSGITEPYIGRQFTDDVYWELFSRLFALEYFENINTTINRADAQGNEIIIRFAFVERPVISRIVFSGNSGIRPNELRETISLKVNDMVTQVKLRLDEMAIIEKYLQKGYPDIKVTAETSPASNDTLSVTFLIEEGEKISVESVRFEGNTVYTPRRLGGQITQKTKGIINDGAFQEANFIADRQALVQYYRDRGYIDADITDASREIRKDDKGNNNMTITYRIYEGRLYTFGGMTFEGNLLFSNAQLSALVYSKTGDTVNDRKLQADIMRISDLYLENGYIFNRFDPVQVRDTEDGVLSYRMVITERGRAHIENIRVKGNVKTKDEVILREIPLESGDVFSKTKVMEGLRNLYNLQFFSQVIPDTPAGSADALMDLVISVEEQPTTDIQLGLTFSGTADPDTFPISAMVKWTDRNFLGQGNIAGVDLNASPDTQSLSLQYTQRWIFGSPLSGSFDFTIQHSGRRAPMNNTPPFFNGDEPYAFPDGFGSWDEYVASGYVPPDEYLMTYDQWLFSIGISSGYRWSTFLGNLTLSGGVRTGMLRNVYDTSIYRPFDPVLRSRNNMWTPSISLWTSLALDQRDVFYDPSNGYYGIQRIGYYGILPMEEEHHIRTDTKLEWFMTLFNIPATETWNFKAVFGIHTGVSFIFLNYLYDNPKIESSNQLAVDGMFTGRGWASEYSNKGNALWENWAELRFPLVPGVISWDFFLDAAGVKKTPGALFKDFSSPDDSGSFFMRFSMGGGLRFTIPQFPLRFSLAKCFKIVDGKIDWMPGAIGWGGGMDFVISFALSSY
ncbi:MAG: outer membrane protein assembly factor BamA [Treponema sp.]|jgi:outer membrane protein insertion porin family|nr:outer membrane protein assembly factor BamA [Treponema sp.]